MAKPSKITIDAFSKMMRKAVQLGYEHGVHRKPRATPLELAVRLKVPGQDARHVLVLYLREAYLAGYHFKHCD